MGCGSLALPESGFAPCVTRSIGGIFRPEADRVRGDFQEHLNGFWRQQNLAAR